MRLTLFLLAFLIAACKDVPQKQPAASPLGDSITLKELYEMDPVMATPLFLKNLFRGADTTVSYFYTFDGEENSRVYYLKAGHVFNAHDTGAVVLYSVSDTECVCCAYNWVNNAWFATTGSRLYVQRFNSSDFRVDYSDFNFDGFTDLFVNFFTTSTAQDVGYVLTYHTDCKCLREHAESCEMTNPTADTLHRRVIAKALNSQDMRWYEQQYALVSDSFKLVSSKLLLQ